MRDKSKKLTVVNTGKKEVATPNLIEKQSSSRPSVLSNTIGISGAEYLLKSIWDSVFEIKTDGSGQKYIYGKLPVVTQYGITMYADNGSLDIPSIYAGLPIDNKTLIRDTNGVLMINPNLDLGSGGGASSWDELEGKPSWIGATKPTYQYSEIQNTPDLSKYISSDDLSKYVTLDTEQTIEGKKDFTTGGLFVNGKQIQYDATSGCWKLEGNLLVTGGVTMYANGTTSGGSSAYSTLGSLLNVDDSIDASASVDRVLFQAAGSSQWVTKPLSEIGGGTVSGDYLPLSGGTINGAGDYLYVPLFVNALNNQISGITFKTNGTERGHIGYHYELGMRLHTVSESGIAISDSDVPIFYTGNGSVKNTIWHEGNDGAGSGLDADMLDGYQWDSFYLKGINNVYNHGKSIGSLTAVNSDANAWNNYLNVNLKLVSSNNAMALSVSGTQNDRRAMIQVGHNTTNYAANTGVLYLNPLGGAVYIGSVEAATINSNVASATKLQTARTIWGQSFDGSGNVDGAFITKASVNYPIRIQQNYSATWASAILATNSALTAGQHYNIDFGYSSSAYNAAWVGYYHAGVGSTSNRLSMGLNSVDDVLNILATGNVGVGTTAPSGKLHVNGGFICKDIIIDKNTDSNASINLRGSTTNLWQISARYSSNDTGLRFYYYNGTAWNAYLNISTDGYIGINVRNPSYGLHLAGTEYIGTSSAYGLIIHRTSTNSGGAFTQYIPNNQNRYSWAVGSDSLYRFGLYYKDTSSNIDTEMMHVDGSGNLWVNGGMTMYSDQRKKTILNHVELSLKQIADAPLIEHYYNSDQEKTTHVGSIAQYWAGLNDWFCKLDNEGYYTMEIQNAALASAISIARHLERYESKTDKKIRQLKKRISQLEDELELLKKGA